MTLHAEICTFTQMEIKENLQPRAGVEIVRGKTKRIVTTDNPYVVSVESFDDITAGDGAKHDVIKGKAVFSTETTCNVFELLNNHGIPTAFIRKVYNDCFYANYCVMLPLEVVARRVALGSYLKRNPDTEKGHRFDEPLIEFFLKTSGRRYREFNLECDDPLIDFDDRQIKLHLPDTEFDKDKPFLELSNSDVFGLRIDVDTLKPQLREITTKVFKVLEEAWRRLGYTLADFKIEFGIEQRHFNLVVADVIDNDSWRVLDTQGRHLDKQLYRDGGDLESVKGQYKLVAELTGSKEFQRA